MIVLLIFMEQKYFAGLNLSSSRCNHIGSLFTNEEEKKPKKLAHDVLDTPATHADLDSDITDMDCRAHDDGAHSPCFHDFQRLIFNKTRP